MIFETGLRTLDPARIITNFIFSQNKSILHLLILMTFLLSFSCAEELINDPETEELVDDPVEEVVIISGTLDPNPSNINRVGLFSAPRGDPIKFDNTTPFAITTVSNSSWSLSIPDITQNSLFNTIKIDGFSGGNAIYTFIVLGWYDIDDDGKFDLISGESFGFGHINSDTIDIAELFYLDDDSSLLIENWSVGSGMLNDTNDNWFIWDDAKSDRIASWIYRDSTYNIVSGIAARERSFFFLETDIGIAVYLTNKEISCLDYPIHSSFLRPHFAVWYPEGTTRAYDGSEIRNEFYGPNGNTSGNGGRAGLSFVDTLDQKQVSGWLAFEDIGGFEEGEITKRAYGSFDVPFCSSVLDSQYIPKEPLSTWELDHLEYSVVSAIAQSGNGPGSVEVIFSDQQISCEDSPISSLPVSSMKIIFPEITSKIYEGLNLDGFFEGPGIFSGGNLLGKAAITMADTSGVMRIEGWLGIHLWESSLNKAIKAHGTFDVPYCAES
ncbi:MAG: hypothetical protein IIB94_06325 [Candidatus Marinimicrobia bacterium]|nr:hypothetical protein [Candidatus Neomarinimicrobiota bacterium]